MSNSPTDQLFELYKRKGLDFGTYVSLHLRHGFVFSTPDFFAMGRPVCRQWTKDDVFNPTMAAPRAIADAWFCHAYAGDISKFWGILPWPLGWIGFQRFDNVLRWVPTEIIRRFHPDDVDQANTLAILAH